MIKTGIIGGTGYTGSELIRLLLRHPSAKLSVVSSRTEKGKKIEDFFPNLRNEIDLNFSDPDSGDLNSCDVVFCAAPNGVAMNHAEKLLDHGVKIIDLSADFRITNVDTWSKWYKLEHACPHLLSEAVYGLPEINRDKISKASLIANPGCYPTAIILGFLPLLEKGLINSAHLIADAKSGVSGAGRNGLIGNSYGEISDSFKSYSASGHRHQPEIKQELSIIADQNIKITFVPHLLPTVRGIEATLYALPNVDLLDLTKLYRQRYAEEPFIDVMSINSHPDTKSVRGSNLVRIACHMPEDSKYIVITVVEDNLVKGAAGQALQNMNLMFGLSETEGLEGISLNP